MSNRVRDIKGAFEDLDQVIRLRILRVSRDKKLDLFEWNKEENSESLKLPWRSGRNQDCSQNMQCKYLAFLFEAVRTFDARLGLNTTQMTEGGWQLKHNRDKRAK